MTKTYNIKLYFNATNYHKSKLKLGDRGKEKRNGGPHHTTPHQHKTTPCNHTIHYTTPRATKKHLTPHQTITPQDHTTPTQPPGHATSHHRPTPHPEPLNTTTRHTKPAPHHTQDHEPPLYNHSTQPGPHRVIETLFRGAVDIGLILSPGTLRLVLRSDAKVFFSLTLQLLSQHEQR